MGDNVKLWLFMMYLPTTLFVWIQLLCILLQTSEASFEPYQINGGLVSAIAGKDFAIIACDTRMIGVGGYLLESRNHLTNRLWSVHDCPLMANVEESLRSNEPVNPSTTITTRSPVMIGSSGCSTDCCQLQRNVRADFRAASYFGQMSNSPEAVATLLSQTLYQRRFFPYYAFCVVCGIDDKNGGCGKAYIYDAIGSYEQVAVATAGTGRELLQPILDRLFQALSNNRQVEGTADDAIETLCKAYRSVSEREIGVGDNLVLHISERKSSEGGVSNRVVVIPLKAH
jgi:20S proteasome subunit beta 6